MGSLIGIFLTWGLKKKILPYPSFVMLTVDIIDATHWHIEKFEIEYLGLEALNLKFLVSRFIILLEGRGGGARKKR